MGNRNVDSKREQRNNIEFIVKELGFNQSQLEHLKENSEEHHHAMTRLSNELRVLKDELFSKLSDNTVNMSTIDSIATIIGNKEKQKDLEVFKHFKMIQDLCNDKQKEKFKVILKDALRQGDQGNRPPPRREGEGHRPPPRDF